MDFLTKMAQNGIIARMSGKTIINNFSFERDDCYDREKNTVSECIRKQQPYGKNSCVAVFLCNCMTGASGAIRFLYVVIKAAIIRKNLMIP